ncbi:MAG: aldo/keto reductase [Mongoliibacter sp.]|uniref:aldo/keto reductase n=1 Tax=Mongoliibacter sp. TaxID=2022438 RepID=UPI0012F407CF|nr:aldo/keto reductase [Mongoliibacter sp.]TVP51432.1 MAG: aldo/keto reductase [Mongoliibacter sp.]
MKYLTFKNGDQLPMIGLGTWKSKPGEVYDAVLWALSAGYRHIDCAAIYDNEKEVGKAFEKAFSDGLVKREEIFVTSKLWNNSHRFEDVIPALKNSLLELRLNYLDLYLIHWPIAFKNGVGFAQTREEFFTYKDVPLSQTWAGMEEAHNQGLTKHIGMSNFNISKLEEVFESAEIKPEMNQIELHPFLPQKKLVEFCKSNGMLVTAYSPLGSGDRAARIKKENEPSLLENDMVRAIADKHNCTVGQVLIAFSIHRDIAVIPKSTNEGRIKENLASIQVDLDADDMKALLNIGTDFRYIDGSFFTGTKSPYTLSDLWEK